METSGRSCRFLRRSLSFIPRSFGFCLGPAQSFAYRKRLGSPCTSLSRLSSAEAFPIKASDHPLGIQTASSADRGVSRAGWMVGFDSELQSGEHLRMSRYQRDAVERLLGKKRAAG